MTVIAQALLARADEVVFPGWTDQEHVTVKLFREFTKLLARQYTDAGLLGATRISSIGASDYYAGRTIGANPVSEAYSTVKFVSARRQKIHG